MSGETITITVTLDDACCLNNALRREIEAAERRDRRDGVIGVSEYAHRLDGCLRAVTLAFEEAVHK